MNANPRDDGAAPPAGGSRAPDRRGSLPLALALGLVGLYIFTILIGSDLAGGLSYIHSASHNPLGLSIAFWVPLTLYVVLAILLAKRPRTSRTGAGLLIAFGVWVLLGGELCIGAMVRVGSTA